MAVHIIFLEAKPIFSEIPILPTLRRPIKML
jgi:hypothetical protein